MNGPMDQSDPGREAVNLGGEDMIQRQVSTLSGGQKQRVAIAGALVESPRRGPPVVCSPFTHTHSHAHTHML